MKQNWRQYQTVPIKNGLNNLKKLSEKIQTYSEKYKKFCDVYKDILENQAIEITNIEDEINKKDNQRKYFLLTKLALKQKKLLSKYENSIYSLNKNINECMEVANNAYLIKSEDTKRFINLKKLYALNHIILVPFKDIIDKKIVLIDGLFDKYNEQVHENPIAQNMQISEDINKELDILLKFVEDVPPIMLFINTIAPARFEKLQTDINKNSKTYAGIFNKNTFAVWKKEIDSKFKNIIVLISNLEIDKAKESIKLIKNKLSKLEADFEESKLAINNFIENKKALVESYKNVKEETERLLLKISSIQKFLILISDKIAFINKFSKYWNNVKIYFNEFDKKVTKPEKPFFINDVLESIEFLKNVIFKQWRLNEKFKELLNNTKSKLEWLNIFNKNKDELIKIQTKNNEAVVKRILKKHNIVINSVISQIANIEHELIKHKSNELFLSQNINNLVNIVTVISKEYEIQKAIAKKVEAKFQLIKNQNSLDENLEYLITKAKNLYNYAFFDDADEVMDKVLRIMKVKI